MSKTYGQILKDVLTDDPEIGRLLFVPDESFDRCARAVILEFVSRVEGKTAELVKSPAHYAAWYDEPEEQALLIAFDQLSTELKEAK